MPNPLIEQFKKDMESFDEKFKDNYGVKMLSNNDIKELKSHHTQSFLNLINKIIEEHEERKKGIPQKTNEYTKELDEAISFDDGYSEALSDIITQLQEFKEWLEELKK